jgi:hypothetical protein
MVEWMGLYILRCGRRIRYRQFLCMLGPLGSPPSLHPVRNLDHKVGIREAWVIGFNLGHGRVGCLLHFLLMPSFDIIVQRTHTTVRRISAPTFTEVVVI